MLWAAWCVESLDYAVALDDDFYVGGQTRGFHPDVIDLAHVRWTAGTAGTAIDLCAAALGAWYCAVAPGAYQLDLRKIRPWARDNKVKRLRSSLPTPARAWVRRTWSDPDYKALLAIRNPFTHYRMARLLSIGGSGHTGRTEFSTLPAGPRRRSATLSARKLVVMAQDLAHRHVQDFLDEIDAGRVGW